MALRWLWVASPRPKRSGVRDTSRKSENSVIMRIAAGRGVWCRAAVRDTDCTDWAATCQASCGYDRLLTCPFQFTGWGLQLASETSLPRKRSGTNAKADRKSVV